MKSTKTSSRQHSLLKNIFLDDKIPLLATAAVLLLAAKLHNDQYAVEYQLLCVFACYKLSLPFFTRLYRSGRQAISANNTELLTSMHDAIRFIDTYWDPYRISLNQIMRLFSGGISKVLFGASLTASFIHPVALGLGVVSNAVNAIYKYNFFEHPSRGGWQQHRCYLLLTFLVALISSSALLRFTASGSIASLRICSIPVSIICAALQLSAEYFNLLFRYQQLRKQSQRAGPNQSRHSHADNDDFAKNSADFSKNIVAFRRKFIINKTLLTVLIISLFSVVFASLLDRLGPMFSFLLAATGLSATTANFLPRTFYPYTFCMKPSTAQRVHNLLHQPHESIFGFLYHGLLCALPEQTRKLRPREVTQT